MQRTSFFLRRILRSTAAALIAVAAFLLPGGNAYAQEAATPSGTVWHIDGLAGSDSLGCGSISSPCRTIQVAIERGVSDDTILVAGSTNGTVYTFGGSTSCSENAGGAVVACLFQKRLTILGGYSSKNWSTANPTANVTVIDGQNAARGVYVLSWNKPTAAALHMEGFTIRNSLGRANSSRAGDNGAFGFGGGMGADYVGYLELRHMVFANNIAAGSHRSSTYGGYGVGGGISMRYVAKAILQDIRFTGNQAQGGNGSGRGGYSVGGALYAHSSNVTGTDLMFRNNRSIAGNTSGSGISGGERADAFGAAGTFMEGSVVTLQRVVAENNISIGGNATDDAGGAFGGAFKVEAADFTLLDSVLRFNTAQGGNARNGWLGNGGAVEGINAALTLNRVVMIGNRGVGGNGTNGYRGGGNGGAVNVTRGDKSGVSGSLTMINCIVAGNTAVNGGGTTSQGGGGGGVYGYNSTITIDHSTIADNSLDSFGYGVAMLFLQNSAVPGNPMLRATVRNSIVSGHSGTTPNQPVLLANNGGQLHFESGLYSGNSGGTIGGIYGLENMSSGSPHFLARGEPDFNYHLDIKSAAIDAGGDGLNVDFENQARSDGKPDFGADEYSMPPMPPIQFDDTRFSKTSISFSWIVGNDVASQTARYRVTHKYFRGGTSGVPLTEEIDVGKATSYRFTDLTPYSLHTVTVDALDSSGAVIATTGASSLLTTDRVLLLPYIDR